MRSKFEDVCAEIYRLAKEIGSGGKLPTVAQLCASLEVTVVTLNTALAEMERRGVIVRRRGSGIYVAPRFGLKSVALLCHPVFFQVGASPFWEVLVQGITRQALQHRESFSLHFVADSDEEPPLHDGLLQQIRDGRIQGILGVGLTNAQTAWVEALGLPYVGYAGAGKYTVVQDYELLLSLGVEQLVAQGCRSVGLWAYVTPYRGRQDAESLLAWQREAVQRVWKRFGLTVSPELICDNASLLENTAGMTTVSRHEQGYRTAQQAFLTEGLPRPDGVVITSDVVARGALVALQKLGITPGSDLKIATHTNVGSSVLIGFEEGLTLIEYDPQDVVSGMFDLLETLMRGDTPHYNVAHVEPRLVLRRPDSRLLAETRFLGEREVLK